MTTFNDVLTFIQGASRDEISAIYAAGKARSKMLVALRDAEAAGTLKVGDHVVTHTLSPKYLNGLKGEIVVVDRSGRKMTAEIKLDDVSTAAAGPRYAPSGRLRGVPIGCLSPEN